MAHLTGTQKKSRNKFIALLVAILLVAAAIFYVIYSAFMAKSAYLENQDFATALATAFDKDARKVSQNDLASVKFLEIVNYGDAAAVTLGDKAFVDAYDKYMAEVDAAQKAEEAGEENIPEVSNLNTSSLRFGEFEVKDDALNLNDIKYFTGVENIALSGVEFDVNGLESLKNLRKANFSGCGLTNDALKILSSKLDLANVEELIFMGNSIDDWSPLESISDKVILQSYGYTLTEDGQLQMVPNEQTLTEYFEEKAATEENNEELSVESEEVAEETAENE